MELKWRKAFDTNWHLYWDDKRIRCAELSPRPSDPKWRVTLSYAVAPMDLEYATKHNTLQEAQEYTENLVRVLIIGGHHERN